MTPQETFSLAYDKLLFEMIKEKTMTSVGLHLSGVKLFFDDNSNFELIGKTFAFFDPVEDAIHVNIEDPFFTDVSSVDHAVSRLMMILFHEAMHKLLNHVPMRKGTKEATLWNLAADFEIHNMLYAYCESFGNAASTLFRKRFEYIKAYLDMCNDLSNYNKKIGDDLDSAIICCFKKDFIGMTAEEIYDALLVDVPKKSGSGHSQKDKGKKVSSGGFANSEIEDVETTTETLKSGAKVKINKIKLKDGANVTTTNEDDNGSEDGNQEKKDDNDSQLQGQMLKNEIESLTENIGKGDIPNKIRSFLGKLIEVKVDWTKILAASITSILEKSDTFTWSRPRTSTMLMDIYLPALNDEASKYGTLILARDESGSMTDDDLRRATDIIVASKEKYSKIILLKHDIDIASIKEYEEIDDEAKREILTAEARGGTSHKAVFKYIRDYYNKHRYDFNEDTLACVILMTDCESDIQQHQHIVPEEVPMVYLVKENSTYPVSYDGIRGQMIFIK